MVRYTEPNPNDMEIPHVGTIYIRKDAFDPMPNKIRVTIVPAD